jgi:mannose-6-phosphate isomerase-like protein (cupin superfamily)
MKVLDYSKIESINSNCGSVKESFTNNIGLARVEMVPGISPAHYHNQTTEYYLIIGGSGILKVKKPEGEIIEAELKPGIILRIDPKEIHQTNNLDSLVLEAITSPAWTAEDEFVVQESLF